MGNEKTGRKAGSSAGKVLANENSTRREKSAAASTLAQVGNNKTTGAAAASNAAKVLGDPSSSASEKRAAASALTQKAKK